MRSINVSDRALKKMAALEDECLGKNAGPLAMTPESVNPVENSEIDYSWDLSTEEKKE